MRGQSRLSCGSRKLQGPTASAHQSLKHVFVMPHFNSIWSLTILGSLLTSHALPAPAPQQSSGVKPEASGANPAVPSGSATSTPPTGPAGFRCSSDLLGIGGEPILDKNTAIVKDFQYVKGQKEDKDLGLYLDFTSVPNPQPIQVSIHACWIVP